MLLNERYEIVGETARHAFAQDTQTGDEVVVKELALGRISDWKELDLFERETDVLRRLDHPAIPDFIDAFEGDGETPTFYLVCEKVPGVGVSEVSLDETRLVTVARRILDVLDYLHRFAPPVVHRNITPDAIIVHDDDVFLVDFGSVQVELQATVGGSTVVGTTGYMAPEQLLGRAVPGSDLYALGVTIIRLLTGLEPSELPTRRMRLQWREHAKFGSEGLLAWVDRMTDPDPLERFSTASEAARALGHPVGELVPMTSTILAQRPAGTTVVLERTDHKLRLRVPRPPLLELKRVLPGLLAIAALCVAGVLLNSSNAAGMAFLLGLVGIVGLIVTGVLVRSHLTSRPAELVLDVDKGYRLRGPEGGLHTGAIADVVTLQSGFGGRGDALWLHTEGKILQVGRGLKKAEIDWLRDEVKSFLGRG